MGRSDSGQSVALEALDRITGVGRRAPSAGFSQGHRLYVVTDGDARRELARLAGEEAYASLGHERWISAAPVHVVVGVREESYHERYRAADKLVDGEEIGWPAPYWYVDAGALFMLLQLAALDEGLVAGGFGGPRERGPEVEAGGGVPRGVPFLFVVTIGPPPPAGGGRP